MSKKSKKKKEKEQKKYVEEVFAAFDEIRQKEVEGIKKYRAEKMEAQKQVFSVIGKPSHPEQLYGGGVMQRYTIEEVVYYLKKQYGANTISVAEAFNYILNIAHLGDIESAKNPIGAITEGFLSDEYLGAVLLLPALQENEYQWPARKNGCLVILGQNDEGLCDYISFDGNNKGYYTLWRYESFILKGDVMPMEE